MWIGPFPTLSTAEVNPSRILPPDRITRMPLGACWSRSGRSDAGSGLTASSTRLQSGVSSPTTDPCRACWRLPSARISQIRWEPPRLLTKPIRPPVRRPGRAAVEPRRGRHANGWRAVEPGDPHVGVAGARAGVGDRLSRRAPGRCPHRAGLVDDQRRLAAAHGGRPQLVAAASIRGEHDRAAVRRPGRLDVVCRVLDQPALAAAVRAHHEEVVRSPATPLDHTICRPSGDHAGSTSSAPGLAVRRAQSAPARVDDVDLAAAAAGARERDPAAVGRDGCAGVAGKQPGQLDTRAAVDPRRCRGNPSARHDRRSVRPPLRTQPRGRRSSRRRSRARRATRNRPTRTLPACGYFYHGRAVADHRYNGARAGVPEWPKGAGCKPAGSAFRGSNPLPCILR